jgi:hypothetical protein
MKFAHLHAPSSEHDRNLDAPSTTRFPTTDDPREVFGLGSEIGGPAYDRKDTTGIRQIGTSVSIDD